MKLKGINIIEQHVEKLVLGLAVVGLLGVAAWQFIGHPNRVQLGGKTVDPGEVDQILKDRADRIAAKLGDDARPDDDSFAQPAPRVLGDFEKSLAGGVSTTDQLARLGPGLGSRLLPIDLGADTWYFEPQIEKPAILAEVVQTADALTPEVVAQYPELAARFPSPTAPKDIVWTTPAAIIDPRALREEMRRSNTTGTPPRMQIPTPWYNDTLIAIDVEFEREELLADGSYGSRVKVDPIPGQTTFRPRLQGQPDAQLRNDLMARLSDKAVQAALLQPDFLPTRNDSFVPPAMPNAGSAPVENEQARQYADMLGRLKSEHTRKTNELTKLGGPLVEPPKDNEKERNRGKDEGNEEGGERGGRGGGALPPPGGGGGLGGNVPGGKGSRGGEGTGPNSDASKKRRINLTKELAKLDERIVSTEAALKEIAPDAVVGGDASASVDLAGDEPVLVWCHDIGVEPGRTYRYRSVLRLYNPFFARSRQLVKEQTRLSDAIGLDSKVSEWSDPVEVTPPVVFFLTRANPGEGQLGLGTVRAEVYRLHDGRWRREEFTIAPGDRIGRPSEGSRLPRESGDAAQAAAEIDFSTDWYVLDIVEDQTADRRGLAEGQKGAIVVLGKLGGGRTELRDPQQDVNSEDRRRLNRDWKLSAAPADGSPTS